MDSKTYWQRRERAALMHYVKDEKEYEKRVQRIYKDMLYNCQKEIDSFYGKYAAKEGITIAEAKKRVAKADIEAYERKAKRYVAEKNFSQTANEEMRLYNTMMKVNRLEMLKANIGLELLAGHSELEGFMGEILQGRTMEELERQAGILGKTIKNNAELAHSIVNASFHNANFSDRIWMYQDQMKNDLSKLLQSGLIQGKGSRELARELRKYWYGDTPNAQGGAVYCMERLMRTELARVQTDAQKKSFEKNGYDKYIFIVNGGCCPICEETAKKDTGHGEKGVYLVKDMMPGTNAPPQHPLCRCSTAAWVDEAEFEAWLDFIDSGGTSEEWAKQKEKPKKAEQKTKEEKAQAESTGKTLKDALKGCKTVGDVSKAVTQYFKEKAGCKIRYVDFGKADIDAAKQMAEMLDALDDKFESSLTSLRVGYLPDSYAGRTTPTNESFERFLKSGKLSELESEIVLNAEYLRSKGAIKHDWESNREIGSVPRTASSSEKYAAVSTMVHEYGHTICPGKANEIFQDVTGQHNPDFMPFRREYNLYMRGLRDKSREIMAVRDSYAGQPNGLRLGLEAAKDLQAEHDAMCISYYSKESVGEFIAEAFADATLSDEPKAVSQKVMKSMTKIFGKENK